MSGRDVGGVVVRLRPAGTIRGHLVFEHDARQPETPRPGFISLRAEPANGDPRLGLPRQSGPPVDRSDDIEIPGLQPGRYLLRANLSAPWILKSVLVNGKDVTDTAIDTTGEQDLSAVVTITNAGATVSGLVVDAQGQIAAGAAIVLFPADPARWSDFGITPFRIKTMSASSAGTFKFSPQVAGDYLIVSLPANDIDAWQEPDFFKKAAAACDAIDDRLGRDENRRPARRRHPIGQGRASMQQPRLITTARVAWLMCVSATMLAQGPGVFAQQQPRDGRTVSATGTAVIAGVVSTTDTPPQPVRKAIVTITSSTMTNSRTAISGEDGKFAISGLPEGRFTVTVKKAAHIPGAYGATRPGRPGTPLALQAGQKAEITLTIARAAVLAGVLRDQQGEPVPGIQVSALRITPSATSGNLFSTSDQTITDDRGAYRIFGLLPGEYAVGAIPRVAGTGQIGSRSPTDMDATLQALQQRRGRGAALPGGTPPVAAPPAPDSFSYAPTYFPGTPAFSQATKIRLAAGDERTDVDFLVAPVRAAILEGSITGAGDAIKSVQLSIQPDGPRVSGLFSMNPVLSRRPGDTNEFRYTNITPGRYRVMARLARNEAPPPAGAGAVVTGGGTSANRAPNAPDTLYAFADIEATGTDVTGVVLSLQPGASLSGRVVFAPGDTKPPIDPTRLRVTISPPGGTYMSSSGGTVVGNAINSVPASAPAADGTFRATGIAPGTYQVRATIPADLSQTWSLQSAIAQGRDLLDFPLEVESGGELPEVVLTLSNQRSELTGTLQTSNGAPAPEFFVVSFPVDRTLWTSPSRRLKSVRPGTDGRFTFADLAAGDYLIAALTDVDPDEWQNVSFLEQLVTSGIKVTIPPGGRVTQDIRVTR